VSAQSAAAEREAVTARRAITPNPGYVAKPKVLIPPLPPLARMPGEFISSTRTTTPRPRPVTPPVEPERPAITARQISEPIKAVQSSNSSVRPASMTDDSDSSYMSAYSHSPPRTLHSLPADDEDDDIDNVLGSGASVAEVLLQDHAVVRDLIRGADSPVLVSPIYERPQSATTTSTARLEMEAASLARHFQLDNHSPTVSDYSTGSTNTTRVTSPTISVGSKNFPVPA